MTDSNFKTDREWWTQQWLDLLNSYRFKKRLERARIYARQGNVLSIDFKDRKVIARVQGTEPEPYKVSLWLDTFSDEDWTFVINTMSERAIFSAKLLAGEMPQNIEEVFAANGLRLFPFNLDDIQSKCSCPDQANPCKHIGAVYYMLGDRFSDDPFVLFQLRGRTKAQILSALRQHRAQETEAELPGDIEGENANILPILPHIIPNIDQFWDYNAQLESSLVVIAPPPSSETVLDILGPLSLAAEGMPKSSGKTSAASGVMQIFKTVYQAVSQQAVLAALNRDNEMNSHPNS